MRTTFVRRTPVVFLLLVAAFVFTRAGREPVDARSTDPASLPLLTSAGLQYVGGFRLPGESSNGDSFSLGGKQLTINPSTNTLFVGTRAGRVAEISIPAPVNSPDVNALPFASFIQGFFDPTEGHISQVAADGAGIDGLLVYGGRLLGTASIYYDALNTQRVSHYSHALQLNQASFTGWSQVWETGKTGYVSGYMAAVPAEWQSILGGPAVTGQCCIPIVTRTSWGPAAFAFNPSNVAAGATLPATPLLYYTGEHPTLGAWEGSNATYGATTQIGGLAIIAGTRTALYFGRNGVGPHCYGNGTGDQSLHGKLGPDGAMWCYDPAASGKGSHAYPYVYQVWAYDLNDFAAVRQGARAPWDVVPYGVWPLNFPTPESSVTVGGVGYDSTKQMLYVSQMFADRDGYSYRPVVHAFSLSATPEPPAPPAGGVQVSLQSDKPSPQIVQTPIAFSAQASGTTSPVEYRWAVHDGTSFTTATPWSPSTQFSWTPGAANLNYRVSVGVRKSGNPSDTPEATASMTYPINNSSSARVSAVTLVSNMSSPQPLNTPIGFTAGATGGTAPYEYKWLIYDGAWRAVTGWSSLSGFTWTPSTAMTYDVGVWVRSAGNTNDEPEASRSLTFTVSPPAVSRLTAVSMSASVPPPQQAGRSIAFTATASGGTAPLQYKWVLYDGNPTWAPLSGWSTQNVYTWTASADNPNYKVGVWVRSGGSTRDEPEVSTSMDYPITPLATAGPVRSVALSADRVPPQRVGTTITATATVTGGSSPYSFKWLIYDGRSWTPMTGWVAANSYAWTPTRFDPHYQIGVWVRSAGSSRDEAEASATLPFMIKK